MFNYFPTYVGVCIEDHKEDKDLDDKTLHSGLHFHVLI